ncbi:MAG: HD domain-containing protein [Campylobacterota bacterium]|nr:HD domain-containing protein [Campylobacterota bacterium]
MSVIEKTSFVFNPIIKELVEDNVAYPFTIYRKVEENIFLILVKKNERFRNSEHTLFKDRVVSDFFIKSDDLEVYHDYIQKHIEDLIYNDNIPVDAKASLLKEMTSSTMNDLFEKEESPENLLKVDSIVDNTIKFILSEEKAVCSILKVSSYDYYTYTHSIDVAVYCIGFGTYLNLNKADISVLGKAAMLHDLGKKKIDNKIIKKKGRLTKEEFEIIKTHPTLSADILKSLGEKDERLLIAIEQHHEKCNGKGYPYGLKDDQISELAKIISICDVFNALNTKRSYKNRLSTYDAFKIMCEDMKNDLSKTHLQKFIQFMGIANIS